MYTHLAYVQIEDKDNTYTYSNRHTIFIYSVSVCICATVCSYLFIYLFLFVYLFTYCVSNVPGFYYPIVLAMTHVVLSYPATKNIITGVCHRCYLRI